MSYNINQKKTILLTAAGGAGTIAIIKSLKGQFHIVATDANRYAGGLYFADKGYVVPASNDADYLRCLDRIIKKEKVDVVIPLIDEELLMLSKYYDGRQDVKVLLPRSEFIEMCLDKFRMGEVLRHHGIPYSKTRLVSSLKKIPAGLFPCIIKPRSGRGSRGFQYLESRRDLLTYLESSPYKKSQLIIQEALQGREFTVSAVVGHDGEILAVVPKEVILKKGITQVGVTRYDKKIQQLVARIQEALRADGPFNVQFMIDKKNKKPVIFEINPRFSTTVALTIAAGVNEVEILIKDKLGLPFAPPAFFKKNLLMIRYQEQHYFFENQLKKNSCAA